MDFASQVKSIAPPCASYLVAILDAKTWKVSFTMSHNLRQTRNSTGQIVARNWGDMKAYCSVDLIPESKAVRQGLAFLSDLGIRMCMVQNFHFRSLFFAGAIWIQ